MGAEESLPAGQEREVASFSHRRLWEQTLRFHYSDPEVAASNFIFGTFVYQRFESRNN